MYTYVYVYVYIYVCVCVCVCVCVFACKMEASQLLPCNLLIIRFFMPDILVYITSHDIYRKTQKSNIDHIRFFRKVYYTYTMYVDVY